MWQSIYYQRNMKASDEVNGQRHRLLPRLDSMDRRSAMLEVESGKRCATILLKSPRTEPALCFAFVGVENKLYRSLAAMCLVRV